MHYYQHHIGDFLKDTANLDDHQIATYMRMIWSYYGSEKPFEDDCESIAFAVRSDEKTVRLILKHYFVLGLDGWRHNRCDREIATYRGKGEKARASANARWKNANALPTHTERNAIEPKNDANQEPITNNHKKIKNTSSAPRRDWVSELVGLGVSADHAKDWLEVRRAKKAKMTDTALKGVQREAAIAGMTLAQAIKMAAENAWQGFKAEWAINKGVNNGRTNESRTLSAVDRVKAGAAERERNRQGAQPEYFDAGDCIEGEFSAGPQIDGPPLDSYGGDFWSQVDEPVR